MQCEAVMKITKFSGTLVLKACECIWKHIVHYMPMLPMLRCFYDPLSAETPLSQPLAMAKIRFEIPQKAAGCGGSDRPTAH